MTVEIPGGLNWFIWRIATHERNRATPHEIETQWTGSQLVDAHLALNVHDDLQRKIAEETERRSKRGR